MWYIEDDEVEDDTYDATSPLYNDNDNDDHNKRNEGSTSESESIISTPTPNGQVEEEEEEEDDIHLPPLPCPCSESTLRTTLSSCDSIQSKLMHSLSSSVSLSRLQCHNNNKKKKLNERNNNIYQYDNNNNISRGIIKGMIIGSTSSFILIVMLLLFMPESTVRWMHHVQTHHVYVLPNTLLQRKSRNRNHHPNINSNNNMKKKKSEERALLHLQEINSYSHSIYHRNGTINRAISTSTYNNNNNNNLQQSSSNTNKKKKQQNQRRSPRHNRHRHLQSVSYTDLYGDDSNSGIVYDSSNENNQPDPIPEILNDDIEPDEDPPKDPQLVIAGKMTVEDGACNVAQLNLKTGKWSLRQRIQLSLYNSYSGGEVYSLLANHSIVTNSNVKEYSTDKEQQSSGGSGSANGGGEGKGGGGGGGDNLLTPHVTDKNFGGNLIVVGAFDTTYRNSQTTYCSVGKWDGSELSKIGEGLCNSALSKGMKITSAAIAGPNDLYVGGSFQTQVWNGNKHEFVKIFNIAHYNAIDQVWLPLPVGQITCSWCTVTILALAWDAERRQLHVAGKFNAIDGSNIPAGLAVYDQDSGHLVAHPGGGLTMKNITQDGVGTAVQFDQENGVLYVMGAFERLTATNEECLGLAAFEIKTGSWTCLADPAHSVLPTGGGNMLLTPYGLLVAGKTTNSTVWPDKSRPYTVAVLKATIKKKVPHIEEETMTSTTSATESYDNDDYNNDDDHSSVSEKVPSKSRQLSSKEDNINGGTSSKEEGNMNGTVNGTIAKAEADHEFVWSWLPGFDGHDEPIHTLSNGFGEYVGTVFIGGDNIISKWSYKTVEVKCNTTQRSSVKGRSSSTSSSSCNQKAFVPVTVDLASDHVHGQIMAISQLDPTIKNAKDKMTKPGVIGYTIIIYCVTLGALIGMFLALLCNKSINQTIMSFIFDRDAASKGISLDTLTYSHVQNTNVAEAYHRAMSNRFVKHPHLLTLIDPQEVILHRIIGEGTFGRVVSSSTV